MENLNKLKVSILADGIIDKSEVEQLKGLLYADGKIDKEEAEFLFELNNEVSGAHNDPSWTDLFVDAITSFLLEDPTSPGVVDEDEAKWLVNMIKGDGKLDETETRLIQNLKSKSSDLPKSITNLIK